MSTKELIACSLGFSVAAFFITFAIMQDIPWLFVVDWVALGLYGLFYLLVKAEYKKNLNGDSYNKKYYKPFTDNHIKSQLGQYNAVEAHQ